MIAVQYTSANPRGFVPVHDWNQVPKRPIPPNNDIENYIMMASVEGVEFQGDCHAAERIPGGWRYTCWNDDPDDFPPEDFKAMVWEFRGVVGTRELPFTNQTVTVYGGQNILDWYEGKTIIASGGPLVVRPWSDFVKPDVEITRYGIWVPDHLYHAHQAHRRPQVHEWLLNSS